MSKWITYGLIALALWFLWSKFGGKITGAIKSV